MHFNIISTSTHLFTEHKKCKIDCKIVKITLKRSVLKYMQPSELCTVQYAALPISDNKHEDVTQLCLFHDLISRQLIITLDF